MVKKLCDSAIEEMFYEAFMTQDQQDLNDLLYNEVYAVPHHLCGVGIEPQFEIVLGGVRYRADFLLRARWLCGNCYSNHEVSLFIELDGHAFHQRSKAQAQKDKSRDRAFVKSGYAIVHFTGSEIYQDADLSCREALEILYSLAAGDSCGFENAWKHIHGSVNAEEKV